MSNTATVSKTSIVNNTDADLTMFRPLIMDSIQNGSPLDEEIADMFSLTIVEASDGIRGIINWA
jgi:hypothetical protein